jgi:hypothetical protein
MLCYALEVELIFTRVNTVSKKVSPQEAAAEERGIKAAIAALGLTNGFEDKEFDDGGAARMVLGEFVAGLVRIGWHCFPRGFHMEAAGGDNDSEVGDDDEEAPIGERLRCFLQFALLPLNERLQEIQDPLEAVMESERVRAVLAYHEPAMLAIFLVYAAADAKSSVMDAATSESVNLPELIFMMKEGALMDQELCRWRDSKLAISAAAPPSRRGPGD